MAFNTDMADSEDDEVIIVDPDLCKCGNKHGTQASPNPRGTKDELMRLGMVLVDNSMRVYVEKLFRPKTRREIDDKNAPTDWFYLTELYNSEDFHPEMNFQDVHTTDIHGKHKLHPETVPEHTRSSAILKEWFTKLRQNLTVWNVKFEACTHEKTAHYAELTLGFTLGFAETASLQTIIMGTPMGEYT